VERACGFGPCRERRIQSSCCRWEAHPAPETAARNLSDVGFAAPLLICNDEHGVQFKNASVFCARDID